MARPLAGSAFSPSNAATRTVPAGSRVGSTNSPIAATSDPPDTACTRAIRPWVLPPPYEVSSRKMAAASPPAPLSRRHTLASRFLSPRVGHVRAKNRAGSPYSSLARPAITCARSAAKSASATLPARMSARGRQVSNIVGIVMSHGLERLKSILQLVSATGNEAPARRLHRRPGSAICHGHTVRVTPRCAMRRLGVTVREAPAHPGEQAKSGTPTRLRFDYRRMTDHRIPASFRVPPSRRRRPSTPPMMPARANTAA